MGEKELKPLADQLKELSGQVEAARGEAKSVDGLRRVEINPSMPEADKLAKIVLDILTNQHSFIDSKDVAKRYAETRRKDEENQWEKVVAWQLLPDSRFRIGGLTPEEQNEREQYVVEQLVADQPLEIDLQTLWVDNIADKNLQLGDLSVIENMVGFAKILQYYRKNGAIFHANISLRVAIEPDSVKPPTQAEFTAYAQKLNQLLNNCLKSAGIDDADTFKIIPQVDLLAVNPNAPEYQASSELETDITKLAKKIEEYWEESRPVFEAYLQEKRRLARNANLTWKQVSEGGCGMHRHANQDDEALNKEFYFRLSLESLKKTKLSKLPSWQALSSDEQTKLGLLTPRTRADLLNNLALITNSSAQHSPEELNENLALVATAARQLATKLIQEKQHLDTPLKFQFGRPLADAAAENTVYLRPFGDLTHDRKQHPWAKPQALRYTQGGLEAAQRSAVRSSYSIPEQSGFTLISATDNDLWLEDTAKVHVGENVVEIPIRYRPQEWLLQLVKKTMEGGHD